MKADGIQGAETAFVVLGVVLDDPAKNLHNLPFLSPEMLDDVRYAQEEGRKLGLRIDVTLGSGWPYGGPNTPLSQAVAALHTVVVDVPANATSASIPPGPPNRPNFSDGDSIISAVIAEPASASASAVPAAGGGRGRNAGPRPPAVDAASARPATLSGNSAAFAAADHPRVAVFFIASHTRQQVKRAAVDADGYVLDPFSHDAVASHLRNVGEPLVKAFGATPPYAIFSTPQAYGADWTPSLPTEFLKRRGYDLIPHLPELVAGTGLAADNLRHDYGKTLTGATSTRTTSTRSPPGPSPITPGSVRKPMESLQFSVAGHCPPKAKARSGAFLYSALGHLRQPTTSATRSPPGETFTWLHSPVFRATPARHESRGRHRLRHGREPDHLHGWAYSHPTAVPEPGWSLTPTTTTPGMCPPSTAYIGPHELAAPARASPPTKSPSAARGRRLGHLLAHHTLPRHQRSDRASSLFAVSAAITSTSSTPEAVDKVGLGSHQVYHPPTDRIPVATLHKITAWAEHGGHVIAIGKLPAARSKASRSPPPTPQPIPTAHPRRRPTPAGPPQRRPT